MAATFSLDTANTGNGLERPTFGSLWLPKRIVGRSAPQTGKSLFATVLLLVQVKRETKEEHMSIITKPRKHVEARGTS